LNALRARFFPIRSYITYWLDAVDEHSLHSPFFFDFYTKVVKAKGAPPSAVLIEKLRTQLLNSTLSVTIDDPGSGSRGMPGAQRPVADIARTSLTPLHFSALYYRIIRYFNYRHIVELGTSLGINSLYLAAHSGCKLTTFEGAHAIAAIARDTFSFDSANNIRLVEGNIDTALPEYLHHAGKIDLALIDANHRYDTTVKYFTWLAARTHSQSIIIVDDIHLHRGMHDAWNAIKDHQLVYASADLFRCGILFFDPSLNKQHVILQFKTLV
jgi:predicted O-methyltransferase YrrM